MQRTGTEPEYIVLLINGSHLCYITSILGRDCFLSVCWKSLHVARVAK